MNKCYICTTCIAMPVAASNSVFPVAIVLFLEYNWTSRAVELDNDKSIWFSGKNQYCWTSLLLIAWLKLTVLLFTRISVFWRRAYSLASIDNIYPRHYVHHSLGSVSIYIIKSSTGLGSTFQDIQSGNIIVVNRLSLFSIQCLTIFVFLSDNWTTRAF